MIPWPPSDSVLVAIIGATAVVLGTVVTVLGAQLSGRMKAIQTQVSSEPTDDGEAPNIHEILNELRSMILPMQRDLAWVMRRQAEADERMDEISDTMPPRPNSRRALRAQRSTWAPPEGE